MNAPNTTTEIGKGRVSRSAQKAFAAALNNLDKLAEVGGAHDAAKASVTAAVTPRAPDANKRGRPPGSGFVERRDPMTTLAQGANAPTFESLLQVATDLGTQAGQGKDTQIKFDLKVLEAAYLGSLDLAPNKHGEGRRDGVLLAEAYTKAQTGATTFDTKAPAGRKLISNIDKMIRLGATPKWGVGEPLQTVNTLVSERQKARKDPAKAKKLDDAHNMLMRFATAQLKSDQLLTGDDLYAYMFRKEPGERSLEEIYEGVRKTMQKLKDGKIPHLPGNDQAPELQTIINACTKRLANIAKTRGVNAATA